ncbi:MULTISPECIES: HNH endonuclease [unclassified Pseudoalteromonas]|uniref:HNH endonuclease n=1 Tax=unclassified Pseudoalteromonas TaxID=194690 RepID=UPI0003F8C2DD
MTAFDLGDNTLSASTLAQLELEYLYDDGSPVDGIDYIVIDNEGIEHTGSLANGVATLANLPQGKSDVLLRATTQADEQQLIQLRNDFKQHLTSMLDEISKQAAIGDAIFEQEDFFTQWMIETGARATGLYQGAKSLVTGIADLIVLGIDVNISVYSACFRMIDAIASGDKHAVKHELETILAFSQKTTSALSDAFELLLALMDDEDTRNTLARFPYDYIEAHSYVDKQRITGVMAFEILLAILTGGVGVAASAASKSKHLASANRALVDMADILKRKQLNKTISHTVSPEQPKLIERIDKPDAALQPGRKYALSFVNAKPIELNTKGQFRDINGLLRTNAGPNAPEFKKWLENGGTVRYDELTDTIIYGKPNMETSSLGQVDIEIPYISGPPDGSRYPDFNEYSIANVKIENMTGVKERYIELPEVGDFSKAWEQLSNQKGDQYLTEKFGIKRRIKGDRVGQWPDKSPLDFTWHHHGDQSSMLLIDQEIHDIFTHKGGASASR